MEGCQILVIEAWTQIQIDTNNIVNKLICKAFDYRQ